MIYRNSRPQETLEERTRRAEARRSAASRRAGDPRHRPDASTPANGDDARFGSRFATFAKGLPHDAFGFVEKGDHDALERALGATSRADAPAGDAPEVRTAEAAGVETSCTVRSADGRWGRPAARRPESPLADRHFALQGPDPAAVAIAPAPKVGESESNAELAELYAMALVRDMTFAELADAEQPIYAPSPAGTPRPYRTAEGRPATVAHLVDELNRLPWFGNGTVRSTLADDLAPGELSMLEIRRLAARREPWARKLTVGSLFRGGLAGDKRGGYLSEFLTLGSDDGPGIAFGAQRIDQRIVPARAGVDYVTSWAEWLDVQNGIAPGGHERRPHERRPIERPRDLAEYVHADQLHQPYFNASLLLLGANAGGESLFDPGFAPGRGACPREDVAAFAPAHVLGLLAEAASRALKAVRHQQFRVHRRARPERLAGMLTLLANGENARLDGAELMALTQLMADLGASPAARHPSALMRWVTEHNARQNGDDVAGCRAHRCHPRKDLPRIDPRRNYLLPLAYPEGSPMHPSYGSSHACVAGACVSVLKALFSTEDASGEPRTMDLLGGDPALEIGHELDKLASNVSIGCNFAGVHVYSDYHDALRLGERVATGLLEERMFEHVEPHALSFTSFDRDRMRIETDGGVRDASVRLIVNGDRFPPRGAAEWWVRDTHEFPLEAPPERRAGGRSGDARDAGDALARMAACHCA